jgi:oxalate decarboxylase
VLAGTFAVTEAELPDFPFTPIDPLLVGKLNPTDPVTATTRI